MALTPFGYVIVDGKVAVNEKQAKQVVGIFKAYIDGHALTQAAAEVGAKMTHSVVGRMLQNKKYLGTKIYPAIIDKETFEAAKKERMKRAVALGRIYEQPESEERPSKKYTYHLSDVEKKYDNPFMQAEYAYSKIESEVADE